MSLINRNTTRVKKYSFITFSIYTELSGKDVRFIFRSMVQLPRVAQVWGPTSFLDIIVKLCLFLTLQTQWISTLLTHWIVKFPYVLQFRKKLKELDIIGFKAGVNPVIVFYMISRIVTYEIVLWCKKEYTF